MPEGNQISINEVRASNLWDWTFWNAYFAEEDLEVKSKMLEEFDSPDFEV